MDVGLGPGDFVFGGDPAPPPRKEGTAPTQFLAPLSHVYCGQTAGWIKIPLGTEVNLGLGNVVLYGGRSPPPKKGTARQCSAHVYCGQTAGWIQTPLGAEVDLGPRKGYSSPFSFRTMSIVATVAHLSYC